MELGQDKPTNLVATAIIIVVWLSLATLVMASAVRVIGEMMATSPEPGLSVLPDR